MQRTGRNNLRAAYRGLALSKAKWTKGVAIKNRRKLSITWRGASSTAYICGRDTKRLYENWLIKNKICRIYGKTTIGWDATSIPIREHAQTIGIAIKQCWRTNRSSRQTHPRSDISKCERILTRTTTCKVKRNWICCLSFARDSSHSGKA